MAAPTISSDEVSKADLGILFVHGIGQQKKADTLISFGEPLKQWLADWIGGAGIGSKDDAVRLLDTHLNIDRSIDEPAHARLRICAGNLTKHWIVAESWWSDSFPPPKYVDFLRWALVVLPVSVINHFERRLRLAYRRGSEHSDQRRTLEDWFQLFLELAKSALFTAIVPVVGAVTILVLTIGLLPIPRVRTWLLAAQATLLGTVGDSYLFVGSALRGSSMAGRTLADLRWLRNRCQRTVIVAHSQGAAVAHAALETAAVYEPAPPTDSFISFGSGIRKLKELEEVSLLRILGSWALSIGIIAFSSALWQTINWLWAGPPAGLELVKFLGNPPTKIWGIDLRNFFGMDFFAAWWIMPVVFAGTFGFLQGVLGIAISKWKKERVSLLDAVVVLLQLTGMYAIGLAVGYSFLFGSRLTILFAVSTLLGSAVLLLLPRKEVDKKLALRQPIPWLDFYAAGDPVSNGPMLDKTDNSIVSSQEVENLSSALFDHITYWQNREQFVSPVCCHIAKLDDVVLDGLQSWDRELLQRARRRRSWRVQCLRLGRIAALLAVALPVIGTRELLFSESGPAPYLVSISLAKLIWTLNLLPFVQIEVPALSPYEARTVLCVMFLSLVLILLAVNGAIWRWWDNFDNQTLFKRESYLFVPVPFLATVTFSCVCLLMSVLIVPNWDRIVYTFISDPYVKEILAFAYGIRMYNPSSIYIVGPIVAFGYALSCAVGAAVVYVVLTVVWRGTRFSNVAALLRMLGPALLAGLLSLLILTPSLQFLVGQSLPIALVLMFIGMVLAALICFAISLGYKLVPSSWILRIVSITGAGPIGLWLLIWPDSTGSLKKLVDLQIRDGNGDAQLGSVADELEKVLIARKLFCDPQNEGDARRLAYACSFPDAAMEMALCFQIQRPELAKEILSWHQSNPAWRIRRAIRKALGPSR